MKDQLELDKRRKQTSKIQGYRSYFLLKLYFGYVYACLNGQIEFWSLYTNEEYVCFAGVKLTAERLLEELDNGVLLCKLIGVIQSTVKKSCNPDDLRASSVFFITF